MIFRSRCWCTKYLQGINICGKERRRGVGKKDNFLYLRQTLEDSTYGGFLLTALPSTGESWLKRDLGCTTLFPYTWHKLSLSFISSWMFILIQQSNHSCQVFLKEEFWLFKNVLYTIVNTIDPRTACRLNAPTPVQSKIRV